MEWKRMISQSIIYFMDLLTIHIPPQALWEYNAARDGKVIIFTGSRITGGFCVTTYSLLLNSKLSHILEECPSLKNCQLSEGEFIQYKGRKYAWLAIDKNGVIKLPHSALDILELQSGMEFRQGRPSRPRAAQSPAGTAALYCI